jgi:glycosyltransferase involved in cell wall biosynthesis
MRILHINENPGVVSGIEKYMRCWDEWSRESGIANKIVEFVTPGDTSSEPMLKFFAEQAVQLCTGRDRDEKSSVAAGAIAEYAPDLIVFHNFDIEAEQDLIERGIPTAKVMHDSRFVCLRGHGFELFSGKACDRPMGVYCLLRCGGLGRDPDGRMRFHGLARKKWGLNHLTRFNIVLTPSDYIRNQLIMNGQDGSRVHAFPPLMNMASGTGNGSNDGNTILFCGRIDRGKGLDLLFEAVRHIRSTYRLRIVGDGKDLDKYKRLVQETGLAQTTTFLGRLYGKDVENEYRNATVIALPSRMPEAFCFSGFEALTWGKPLVAFRIGAIKEWLSDGVGGYAVDAGNTRQFGQRMAELLQDKGLRERIADAGKKYLETSFSVQSKGQKFAMRLRDLVNKHLPSPTEPESSETRT